METRSRLMLAVIALGVAATAAGCRSVICGAGTRLEGGQCVCEVAAALGGEKAAPGGSAATAEPAPVADAAEEQPKSARPTEQDLAAMARRLLRKQRHANMFRVTTLRVTNVLSEDKTITAKVTYTAVGTNQIGNWTSLLGGAKDILPLGRVHRGQSYTVSFKIVVKKYDQGWDVDSYERQ